MPYYIKDKDGKYCGCGWQYGYPWHDSESGHYYTVTGLAKEEATSFKSEDDAISALECSDEGVGDYAVVFEGVY
jgi:hypothetical protein